MFFESMTSEADFETCLQSWGFNRDPFVEEYRNDIWARPEKDLKKLKYYLTNSKKQKNLLNILLKGDYGSGKTYTLKFIKGYVEKELGGCGIYFLIPKKYGAHGFRDILNEFMKAVTVKRLEQIGKEISTENNIKSFEEFKQFLESLPLDPDFAHAISNLVYNQQYAETSAWLYGKTTAFQDKIIKMDFSTKDESTIITVISNVIFLLSIKNPIVALLIDEIENLSGESVSTRSVREGFRNLYDELLDTKNKNSVVIISAVTARAVYEIQSSMGTALLDRISYDIPLNPLNEYECKEYLKILFKNSRDSKDPSPIPPFVDDPAVDHFIKIFPNSKVVPAISFGEIRTPRRMMKVGSFLLNEACFNDQAITSEFIDQTLK